MNSPILIARHSKNGTIKVYIADEQDFRIITSGDCIKFPEIWSSRTISANDAAFSAIGLNKAEITEIIKK